MIKNVSIKIQESPELAASKEHIPIGRHKINLTASIDGFLAGKCTIDINRLHSEAPPSAVVMFFDFPNNSTAFVISARKLLFELTQHMKKRGLERASFRAIKNEPLMSELAKHSGLFARRSNELADYYYFNPTGKPIIKREFMKVLRKRNPRRRLVPQLKPVRIGAKGTKRPMRH